VFLVLPDSVSGKAHPPGAGSAQQQVKLKLRAITNRDLYRDRAVNNVFHDAVGKILLLRIAAPALKTQNQR